MQALASFDDGTIEDLKLAEILSKYSIETTLYWPTQPTRANGLRRSMNMEQRLELSKSFEIGSHTMTHPLLTRIPIESARIEIEHSRVILQAELNQPIYKFAYPRGYANAELELLVKNAGYLSARSTLVGYIHESENPFFQQTAVHVGCQRKEYGSQDWLDYALFLLQEAQNTPNSVFHIWGHSWEIEKNKAWGGLETLLKAMS